ncbi:MAG: tetratricopeptide repeat protein [Flavobacteriaceae bacterium]|nr:MAG: tetratricopeptide repeat protein [Flavobacteriaceae bacterium]
MGKRILFTVVLFLKVVFGFAQNENENILYIVDSIPIIEEPKEGFGTLTENEIDRVEMIKDKASIELTGYKNLDKIIYVFTKEYALRSDSIKAIPTTKLMVKKNGTWYLKGDKNPYSGLFIDYYLNGKKQEEGTLSNGRLMGKRLMYHLNGKVSDEIDYNRGVTNGMEKRFYEDGTLMQKGEYQNGKEIGVWEMYHPNGQLKQHSIFENGKLEGESISYYSTGELKGKNLYKNGVYQKNKINDKIFELYNQAQSYYKEGNFKSAIRKYTKCIALKPDLADMYFARGSAKLNNLEFDKAIIDFNKAIEIEPFYTNAYSNRAFALIRKYEFNDSRTLSKNKGVHNILSRNSYF